MKNYFRFFILVIAPIVGFVIGISSIAAGVYFGNLILILFGVLVLIATAVVKTNVKRVSALEVIIIDRGGNLIEKSGGYVFLIPILDAEKKRLPKEGRKFKIDLFEEELWFDLAGGGKITIHGAEVWLSINDGLELIKGDVDYEDRVRETAQSIIRGFINTITVKELQNMGKKNNNMKEIIQKEIQKEFGKEKYLEFHSFTFDNFDFDSETTAVNKKIHQAEAQIEVEEKNAKAAEKRAKANFHERLGDFIHQVAVSNAVSYSKAKEIIKQDPELQREMRSLYRNFRERELTDVTDIRVSGNEKKGEPSSLKKAIIEMITLMKGNASSGGGSGESKKKDKNKKKKKGTLILKGSDPDNPRKI